jgi:hypothetical protein
MKLLLNLFVLAVVAVVSKGDHVLCTNLLPHQNGASGAPGNGGYYIFSLALDGYTPGESYEVVLAGESPFEAFVVVAQDGAGAEQGMWAVQDTAKSMPTDCNGTISPSLPMAPCKVLQTPS